MASVNARLYPQPNVILNTSQYAETICHHWYWSWLPEFRQLKTSKALGSVRGDYKPACSECPADPEPDPSLTLMQRNSPCKCCKLNVLCFKAINCVPRPFPLSRNGCVKSQHHLARGPGTCSDIASTAPLLIESRQHTATGYTMDDK